MLRSRILQEPIGGGHEAPCEQVDVETKMGRLLIDRLFI
jgi:hypothetical protein